MMDDVLTLGKERSRRRLPGRFGILFAAIALAVASAVSLVSHLPTQHGTHRPTHAAKAFPAKPATRERLDYPERPDGPVQLAGLGSSAARLLNARSP